jgi:hypothetical protein
LQTWKTFIHNHAEGIASIDMFVVPTVAFQQLFACLVLGHRRRQLLWFAVTRNPTAEWLARQITETFPWDTAPKYLVRDNDRAFGAAFKARVRAMGIRDRPTSFRSPWQNGHVERLIGSTRRECTDHMIVLNEGHLRRILSKYASYYNEVRTHLALGKDARTLHALGRAVRNHRRATDPWRATPSVCANLSFRKGQVRQSCSLLLTRARTSGENLFVVLLVIAPLSQELEPPINPERFTFRSCISSSEQN